MTVKQGYKLTEVGVIPEDWAVCCLGDAIKLQRGFDLPYRLRVLGDVPVISSSGVSGYHHKSMSIAPGVVTGRYGTIGEVFFIKQDFWPLNTTLYVSEFKKTNPIYTYHLLKTIDFSSHSGKSGVPGVNRNDVHEEKIAIPTFTEQTAIANALSNADAYINSLEQLIAKKQLIKQGTMQQLLTGKKRLEGFSGEWEEKFLKSICWYQEGPGVRKYQFTSGGVKLLNGTNISNGSINLESTDKFISTAEAFGNYSHFLAHEGDLVIASSGVTIERFHEKIAFIKSEHLPLCMNTSTIRFKPDSLKLSKEYLFYFLSSKNFKIQINGQATGSAQLNFGPSHLDKIIIIIPSIKEQTAIANILTNIDNDIQTLKNKLTKAKQIKQGMMQELLTGKTRLVQPHSANSESNNE